MIPIYREKDRAKLFSRLEKRKTLFSGEVLESVRRILSEVRAEGDRALLRLTEAFDGIKMTPERMCVSPQELNVFGSRVPATKIKILDSLFLKAQKGVPEQKTSAAVRFRPRSRR